MQGAAAYLIIHVFRVRLLLLTVLRSGKSSLRLRIASWLRASGAQISGMDDVCLWNSFHSEALSRKEWILFAILLLFIHVVFIHEAFSLNRAPLHS